MITVDTVKKSWENFMLTKCAANYWLTYRSGKDATNLSGETFINSEQSKFSSYKLVQKCFSAITEFCQSF